MATKLHTLLICGAALMTTSCGQPLKNDNAAAPEEQTASVVLEKDIVKDILEGKATLDLNQFTWVNAPKEYAIEGGKLTLITEEKTDLWQHTLNGADLSNAPVLMLQTQQDFTFTVKTEFSDAKTMYDQCGPIIYMDRDNWLKASVENAGEEGGYLGSVNNIDGHSDWATSTIPGDIKTVWYKVNRMGCDVIVSSSTNGQKYSILRFAHMNKAEDVVGIGLYACSPGEGASFKAVYSDMSFSK